VRRKDEISPLFLERLAVGEFQANCYILADQDTREAMVIDPGGEGERILKVIEDNFLGIVSIVLTHGHLDHIGAVQALTSQSGGSLLIHSEDAFLLGHSSVGMSYTKEREKPSPLRLKMLEDKDKLWVGKFSFLILHTPGHTPGSISIYGEGRVFTGDTLFAGGVGRCDLPGGDWQRLKESIQDKLLKLPPETVVHPGHGPDTTLEKELRNNPFIHEFRTKR
jgi:glyoxylase-like metal-dependent hydrolase (beta-lactamase superfamily II)